MKESPNKLRQNRY